MWKLGDKVKWVSQSGGYTKIKTGVIVGVVPPNHRGSLLDYVEGYNRTAVKREFNTNPVAACGVSRMHESYLVAVTKSEKSKPSLYWPRVTYLKTVDS